MIKIKLIYFSRIREILGKSSEELSIKANTIRELIDELQSVGKEYSVLNGENFRVCFAVDQVLINDFDFSISGATEVAFFPPMTGG